MGNISEKAKKSQIFKDYKFIGLQKHSQLGELLLLNNIAKSNHILVKEQTFQNVQDFESCYKNLNLCRTSRKHNNIIEILDVKYFSEDVLCSKAYKIIWVLEDSCEDLLIQMRRNKLLNNYYQEKELWKIMTDLTSNLHFF